MSALRQRLAAVLPAQSLRARLAHGALWTVTGSLLGQGTSAVAAILLARLLGQVAYGEWGILQGAMAMLAAFAGLALGATANKHIAEFRQSDPNRAGRILALATVVAACSGVVMAAALLVLAPYLATHALHAPYLTRPLRMAAPALVFTSVASMQLGALSGFEAFKKQALWSALVALINGACVLTGARLVGLSGAVLGYVTSSAAGCILYRSVLRRECERTGTRIRYLHSWKERPLLWSFAVPSTLAGLMVAPVSWAASALLVRAPNGFAENAIFTAANQWRAMLMFLPATLATPLLPMMCQLYAQGQYDRLRRILSRALITNVLLVLAGAGLLAVFGRYILLAYGRGFQAGLPTLYTVLGVSVVLAAGMVANNLIVATGALWAGFWLNVMWAVVLLGASAPLARAYGSFGLGLAYLTAYAANLVAVLVYLRYRYEGLRTMQVGRVC